MNSSISFGTMTRNVAAHVDQRASWVELFFDLVFVFSITKIVELLHGHVTWPVIGQALIAFWMVWWAWTQFTWALNAADTSHPTVQLATLAATAVAFFMVATVSGAFGARAMGFAVSYVAVRLLGLGIYVWVASADPRQRAAVRLFSAAALPGLAAAVIGATQGGATQTTWWAVAIALELVAAVVGGRQEGWNLHAPHFCERHGLFVIIALGESLIVAATGLSRDVWSSALLIDAVLAVATACALWWSYFGKARGWLEEGLHAHHGSQQSRMARDAFSLLHIPLIVGVIAYAAAIEAILSHPHEPLALDMRLLLGAGMLLFSGATALAVWRAGCRLLWPRLVLTGAAALTVAAVGNVPPAVSLAVMLAGMAASAAVEQFTNPNPAHTPWRGARPAAATG